MNHEKREEILCLNQLYLVLTLNNICLVLTLKRSQGVYDPEDGGSVNMFFNEN